MRKSLFSIAFWTIFGTAGAAFSADSLFSQVAVDSVFSSGSSTQPVGGSDAETGQGPLAGLGALTETLRNAGFETKEITTEVVMAKAKASGISTPVLANLSDDKTELVLVMVLREVQDEGELPPAKLLGLLSANRLHTPAFFSYSQKRKRLELHRVLANRAVTSQRLRQEIDRLAGIAGQTRSLWSSGESATAPGSSGNIVPSLAGKWSAVRSDREAFALRLNADGTFLLVHVSDGTQSHSSGKFTVSGTSLKFMAGDSTVLSGTLSRKSNDEFHFLPQNAASTAALAFKRS